MNIVDQARAIIVGAICKVENGDTVWLAQMADKVEAAAPVDIPSWLVLDAVIEAIKSQPAVHTREEIARIIDPDAALASWRQINRSESRWNAALAKADAILRAQGSGV